MWGFSAQVLLENGDVVRFNAAPGAREAVVKFTQCTIFLNKLPQKAR